MGSHTVVVNLTVLGGQDTHPSRRFRMVPSQKVFIGRASLRRTSNDRPAPAYDNAFFDCPVVSRRHGLFTLNDTGILSLVDNDSRHGCFVNSRRVRNGEEKELKSGDIIDIGGNLTPSDERSHASLKFSLEYYEQSSVQEPTASKGPRSCSFSSKQSTTFVVPDSSGESEASDHDSLDIDDDDFEVLQAAATSADSKLRTSGIFDEKDKETTPPSAAVINLVDDEDEPRIALDLTNATIPSPSELGALVEYEKQLEELEEAEKSSKKAWESVESPSEPCGPAKSTNGGWKSTKFPDSPWNQTNSADRHQALRLDASNWAFGKDAPASAPRSITPLPQTTPEPTGQTDEVLDKNSSYANAPGATASMSIGRIVENISHGIDSAERLSNETPSVSPQSPQYHSYYPVNGIGRDPYGRVVQPRHSTLPLPSIELYPRSETRDTVIEADRAPKRADPMKIDKLLNATSDSNVVLGQKRKASSNESALIQYLDPARLHRHAEDKDGTASNATAIPASSQKHVLEQVNCSTEGNDLIATENLFSESEAVSTASSSDCAEAPNTEPSTSVTKRPITHRELDADTSTGEPSSKRVRLSHPSAQPNNQTEPRSRSNTSMIAPFMLGALVGGIGLFGALINMPESFF